MDQNTKFDVISDINEYSREILVKIAENDYGIATYPKATNPSKPNKQEIADAINFEHRKVNNIQAETTTKTKREERALETKRLNTEAGSLVRVVITDSYPSQKHEGDDSNRVEIIGYGNDRYGHKNDKIIFGKPWHIHRGAYDNLKAVMHTPKNVNTKTQKMVLSAPVPRYNIEVLPLLTVLEVENLKKVQALRKAAGQ